MACCPENSRAYGTNLWIWCLLKLQCFASRRTGTMTESLDLRARRTELTHRFMFVQQLRWVKLRQATFQAKINIVSSNAETNECEEWLHSQRVHASTVLHCGRIAGPVAKQRFLDDRTAISHTYQASGKSYIIYGVPRCEIHSNRDGTR